jgi:Flp pilus assembly protein TadG
MLLKLCRHHQRRERGSVLLEFALISLFVYVLVAGGVELGRMVFVAQGAQEAARIAARELAITPLPADMTFQQALQQPIVLQRIFDASKLVIDLSLFPNQAAMDAFLDGLPAVNKALRPLMIVEQVQIGSTTFNLLRYPGALLSNPATSTTFSVEIPRVEARGVDGVETIRWVPVLEEIRPDPADPNTWPFSFTSTGPQSGVVAVRINYPFQAAALSGYQQSPSGLFEANWGNRILADDAGVTQLNNPISGTVQNPVNPLFSTYGGPFGLGSQFAMAGKTLRPYRKLISAQAIFRREVYQ